MGALGCIQGRLRARSRPLLTPVTAVNLLRTTGSPQQASPAAPVSQRIGNRPDLRQALRNLGVGKAVLKDTIKDGKEVIKDGGKDKIEVKEFKDKDLKEGKELIKEKDFKEIEKGQLDKLKDIKEIREGGIDVIRPGE